jgi:hypothetical protein
MNAKRVIAFIALFSLFCIVVSAQAGKGGDPIITIENGYGVGYNLNQSDIGTGLNFTLGLGVAENFQVCISYVDGDANYGDYRLFGIAYDLTQRIGITTTIGQKTAGVPSTGPIAGLGLYASVFQREVGDLKTAFKIKLDYITPLANFTQGVFRVDLMASIGI